MDQNNLNAAFFRLKKEVITFLVASAPDDFDQTKIESKWLRILLKEIEDITGLSNAVTERTLKKYYQAKDYDPSYYSVSYIAAVWLCNAKIIDKQKVIEFYKNEKRTSDYYWNQYLHALAKEAITEEPGPVPVEERQLKQLDDLSKFDSIFHEPEIDGFIERNGTLDKLMDLVSKQRLVVVDGIAGIGKKTLVKNMQQHLTRAHRYQRVFWKHCGKNFTAEQLLSEVGSKIQLDGANSSQKTLRFIEYLKQNQLLLVLYGFDKADGGSFEFMFKSLNMGGGSAHIIVIRDNLTVFEYIPARHRTTVKGFSPQEIALYANKQDINLSDEGISKIMQLSDGLPFYVDLLVKAFKDTKDNEDNVYNELFSKSELEYWIKQCCAALSDEDKKLLQLLSILGRNFTEKEVYQLADKINLHQVESSFQQLVNYHIVWPLKNDYWKIVAPIADYYRTKYDRKEHKRFHQLIADHVSITNKPLALKTFTKNQLIIQSNAILHDLHATNFLRSSPFLNVIVPLLKHHNLFPTLYELLNIEVENNPEQDPWKRWHLAHCCFVLGKFQECINHLKICITTAFNWYEQKAHIKNGGLSFFIKSLQLFSELVGAAISYDEAHKALVGCMSAFETTDLEWDIRCHALADLAVCYQKKEEYEKSKSIIETLLAENNAGAKHSTAIFHTHLGIVLYKLKQYALAEENLKKGLEFFTDIDERGKAWSGRYLVLVGIKLKTTKWKYLVSEIISIHLDGRLHDPEFADWLNEVSKLKDPKTEQDVSRALQAIQEQNVLSSQDAVSKEIRQQIGLVSKFFVKHTKVPFVFDALVDPISEHLSMESRLAKSMVRKIRKDPHHYMSRLRHKKVGEIFRSEKNNRILIECLGTDEYRDEILKEFVYPNLELIKRLDKRYDDIKIKYAGRLHNAGDQDNALSLLDAVAGQNKRFHYLNTRANCLRKKGEKESSESLYEMAGKAARTSREKGIHFHNLALMIYESREVERYEEAKEYCKRSIRFREEDQRFIRYPISTLVLLEIETAEIENVVSEVTHLKYRYKISPGWLSNIIRDVRNRSKRKILQKEFPPKWD